MHVAFVEKFGSKDAQERRGASTFALAALAGEIANSAGIVPWTEGDAFAAADHVFNNWLSARESSYRGSEHASILRAVSDFIDRHSDSRFSNIKGDLPEDERIVYNRAGYWDEPSTERIYLFTADGLREATKRHDFNRVLRALDEAGALYKTDKTQKAVTTRTPDGRTPRLYWINPAPLDFPQKPKDRTAT